MSDYISEIRKKVGHDRLIMVGDGIILYEDGKVLLQKRRVNNRWVLHGGCVDVGEIVEEAAKRELYEETGLTANNIKLLGVFSGEDRMFTYSNGGEVYMIGIVYVCNNFSGELRPEANEVYELKWFDINNLPEEINPPNRKPLQQFVQYINRIN